jgi:outer membrane protein assembly factor BamE
MRVLFLSLIAVALAGCSSWGFPGVYKINVEQGNIVTSEMVDQLKPGMSRRQVRYILGTPLLEDSFDRDRWDYLYMLRNGDTLLVENRLSIYFEGDTMAHFTSTLPPLAPIEVAEPEEPLQ